MAEVDIDRQLVVTSTVGHVVGSTLLCRCDRSQAAEGAVPPREERLVKAKPGNRTPACLAFQTRCRATLPQREFRGKQGRRRCNLDMLACCPLLLCCGDTMCPPVVPTANARLPRVVGLQQVVGGHRLIGTFSNTLVLIGGLPEALVSQPRLTPVLLLPCM